MASSVQRFGRFLIATAIVAAPVPPARAVPPAPVSVVTAAAYTYAPGDLDTPELRLQVVEGGRLFFANLDVMGAHNIVSEAENESNEPLFETPTINSNDVAEVVGVPSLRTGSYAFACTVHNPVMEGLLEVVPE